MPHIITQWETMQWRRDDPDTNRLSKLSIDSKGKHVSSTPRGTLGGLKDLSTNSETVAWYNGQAYSNESSPTSPVSTVFSERPSPTSSIDSAQSFEIFELADTSLAPPNPTPQAKVHHPDSHKETVYHHTVANINVSTPPLGTRVKDRALSAKLADRVESLYEQNEQLKADLAIKDQALNSAREVASAREKENEQLRTQILELQNRITHCDHYHRPPAAPPKSRFAATDTVVPVRPTTSYTSSPVIVTNFSHPSTPPPIPGKSETSTVSIVGPRVISGVIPGTFQHNASGNTLFFPGPPKPTSAKESHRVRAVRHSTSSPAIRQKQHQQQRLQQLQQQQQEQQERDKKGIFGGIFRK